MQDKNTRVPFFSAGDGSFYIVPLINGTVKVGFGDAEKIVDYKKALESIKDLPTVGLKSAVYNASKIANAIYDCET